MGEKHNENVEAQRLEKPAAWWTQGCWFKPQNQQVRVPLPVSTLITTLGSCSPDCGSSSPLFLCICSVNCSVHWSIVEGISLRRPMKWLIELFLWSATVASMIQRFLLRSSFAVFLSLCAFIERLKMILCCWFPESWLPRLRSLVTWCFKIIIITQELL